MADGSTRLLRMFPLNNVVFPTAYVPLRVFEPRYLKLIGECLAEDEPFGMVLIERGFEVGGGDQRFTIGTEVEIAELAPLEDNQLVVMARGVDRLVVQEWLEDDPYPKAMVARMDETATGDDVEARIDAVDRALRRFLGLASELGADVSGFRIELDRSDPIAASYQAAILSPLGSLDAQRVLEAPGATERLALLEQLIAEECVLLEHRLGEG